MRLYLTPADFAETALGTYWTANAAATAVARALARGSRAADTLIRGHLGQPGASTTTSPISPGTTAIPVASTINLAEGDLLDLGNGAERILITGVTVSSWTAPYPGTVLLAAPTSNGYGSGTAVLGLYRERWSARGGSTNTMELSGPLTQEGQMAQAHAPEAGYTDLVRTIFVGGAPLTQLLSSSVVYRYGGAPVPLALANMAVNVEQGWYRLPLGTYVPQGSDVETVYIGGWATIPDDASEAVGLLAADDLASGNPYAAAGLTMYKQSGIQLQTVVPRDPSGKSLLRTRAEALLIGFTRMV